jgi:hypothetical protein
VQQEKSTWWLTRWLKSEAFWQGIAVQTLGTLAAAIIIALVAILLGIGYTPAVRYFVLSGLVILVGLLLVIAITAGGFRLLGRLLSTQVFKRHPFWIGLLFTTLALVGIVFVWVAATVTVASIQTAIARWTGYIPS